MASEFDEEFIDASLDALIDIFMLYRATGVNMPTDTIKAHKVKAKTSIKHVFELVDKA